MLKKLNKACNIYIHQLNMNLKLNLIVIIFLFNQVNGLTQDITSIKSKETDKVSNQKIQISKYSGGRFGFSGIYLTLFSDSTYYYSCWLDNGFSFTDEGTFRTTKSYIILCSKEYFDKSLSRKKQKQAIFKNKPYRMIKNKILLFSEKEEKKDKDNYYSSYLTLHLENKKNNE
jgi:hypothetical protein